MALDGVSLAETLDRALESMEQDQIACMCRLTLIYTLCKFSPRWRKAVCVKPCSAKQALNGSAKYIDLCQPVFADTGRNLFWGHFFCQIKDHYTL